MATAMQVLRCCTRGSGLIVQSALLRNATNGHQTVSKKIFSSSPVLTNYFAARRGPFTPEEKKGKGHLMTASTHWKVERVLMISMVPVLPLALFYQSPVIDHLLSTVVFLHGFWGMEGVLTDYLYKFAPWLKQIWYVISIVAFAGLINFNYNDVGVCKAVAMLWSL